MYFITQSKIIKQGENVIAATICVVQGCGIFSNWKIMYAQNNYNNSDNKRSWIWCRDKGIEGHFLDVKRPQFLVQ